MSLIRMAFWISLIILLLPSDERRQAEFYNKASGAVSWAVTFCDRNGETCAKGGDLWKGFKAKAEFGGKIVVDLVQNALSGSVETVSGQGKPQQQQPAVAPASARSGQAPLAPDDLTQKWRGQLKAPRG